MGGCENTVLTGIDCRALALRVSTPQHKNNGQLAGINCRHYGVCEPLPPPPLMGSRSTMFH